MVRAAGLERVSWLGRRSFAGASAALAACAVVGVFAPAVQASAAPAATWTKQAPAASPVARALAAITYDAATGNVVLFGGVSSGGRLGDTWTWNGSTWTKQAPVASPPARYSAAMAYDTATSSAVLFGGQNKGFGGYLSDTWTWG